MRTEHNVSNVLHKTSKQPLPLFFIDLDPAEINKEIFQLNIYFTPIYPSKNLTNAVSLFNAQIVKIMVTQKSIVLTHQDASAA